jgi:hypothetical protein
VADVNVIVIVLSAAVSAAVHSASQTEFALPQSANISNSNVALIFVVL